MIYLENGILLNLEDCTSVKRIVFENAKCFRLEIHYHLDIVSFDYIDVVSLDNDYEKIKNGLERLCD